ncbi:MAG: arylesterase [Cyclobacteriaceae bacterium]
MRNLIISTYSLFCVLLLACGQQTNKNHEAESQSHVEQNTRVPEKLDSKVILFYGTSLTAGMGLDPDEAYPAIIQRKIDSLNLPYEVINAGLSGETTSGGKSRIGWTLSQPIDVFVLELGVNDGLRGINLDETRKNLQAIIDTVRHKNPETKIIMAGMQIPPNLGAAYTSEFRDLFPELAEKNNIPLIPFLLENVAGIPALNQPDGIHPTAAGQTIIAENAWPFIVEALE